MTAEIDAPAFLRGITEAQFMATVIDAATNLGYRVHHERFSVGSRPGFPDLVIMGKGRVIFAELKDDRRKPTPAQQEYLDYLRSEGIDAYLWRPSDWDDIEDILKWGG